MTEKRNKILIPTSISEHGFNTASKELPNRSLLYDESNKRLFIKGSDGNLVLLGDSMFLSTTLGEMLNSIKNNSSAISDLQLKIDAVSNQNKVLSEQNATLLSQNETLRKENQNLTNRITELEKNQTNPPMEQNVKSVGQETTGLFTNADHDFNKQNSLNARRR